MWMLAFLLDSAGPAVTSRTLQDDEDEGLPGVVIGLIFGVIAAVLVCVILYVFMKMAEAKKEKARLRAMQYGLEQDV